MTARTLPEEMHRTAEASRDELAVALPAGARGPMPAGLAGGEGHGVIKDQPWIQTYSGGAFPLLTPGPEHVHLRDISEALAKLCRFTGHTRWPYSVAQHSLYVADLVRAYGRIDAEPYALLHDAHEAYVGDVATPMKRALDALGRESAGRPTNPSASSALDRLVDPIDRAIHARFGLAWPPAPDVQDIVKHCDLMALATERRDVLLDGPDWRMPLPSPAAERIEQQPWHWEDAAERFHVRAFKLGLVR